MKGETVAAFDAASIFFADAVALVPDEAWARPGLGDWTVLELVAHAQRAHTTIERYLLDPRPPEPPDGPYFAPDAIARRGREAVAELGDDPARAVALGAQRVRALVRATPADAALGSPAGAMTLAAYLPSRVAELTIHGLDLTYATATELVPPTAALEVTLAFLARRAADRDPVEVVRALTGRAALPAGYSVY